MTCYPSAFGNVLGTGLGSPSLSNNTVSNTGDPYWQWSINTYPGTTTQSLPTQHKTCITWRNLEDMSHSCEFRITVGWGQEVRFTARTISLKAEHLRPDPYESRHGWAGVIDALDWCDANGWGYDPKVRENATVELVAAQVD